MVIVLIVLIWIAALAYVAFRRISAHDADNSVQRYHSQTRSFRRVLPRIRRQNRETHLDGDEAHHGAPRVLAEKNDREQLSTRAAACRARRRRVLAVLLGSIGFTLVFGAVPALRFLWSLCIVVTVLTCIYMGLLVYFARMSAIATARSQKVVPLRVVGGPAMKEQRRRPNDERGNRLRAEPLPPVQPSFVVVQAN